MRSARRAWKGFAWVPQRRGASATSWATRSACPRSGGLASDEAHLDLVQAGGVLGAKLRVAIGPLRPDRSDRFRDLVIARAAAHERAQVVALRREEARVQRAIGGKACSGAVRAERLGHRGDDPD